jgi:hypothetical protein
VEAGGSGKGGKMKLYTIDYENVAKGVDVRQFELANGTKIPAIVIGETGRGQRLGVLPVRLTPASMEEFRRKRSTKIAHGVLVQTKTGRPALQETEYTTDDNEVLIVFLAGIGYRGGNSLDTYPESGRISDHIIVSGKIAQGEAGRMGAGGQWILRARPGDRFRFTKSGRLYGAPSTYIVDIRTVEDVWMMPKEQYALAAALAEF